jgi:hypothetical protein
MIATEANRDLDDLIAESQRIRDELIRTVARLEVFTMQLAEEVSKLSNATTEDDPNG